MKAAHKFVVLHHKQKTGFGHLQRGPCTKGAAKIRSSHSLVITVTDLVLHGCNGAVRHPVHLVGQRRRKGQSPTRRGRAARLLDLRCRSILGLAAFVAQVLERAQHKNRRTKDSALSIRGQCCPCQAPNTRKGHTTKKGRGADRTGRVQTEG